jgi:hypothetical protein
MNNKVTGLIAAVVLAVGVSARASAECSIPLEVVGTKSDTIRTYNEDGSLKGSVEKSVVLNQKALDCDESLGLVKIQLASQEIVWIKRSETRRVADASAPSKVCVTEVVSRPRDYSVTAVSGAEPTPVNCKPASE